MSKQSTKPDEVPEYVAEVEEFSPVLSNRIETLDSYQAYHHPNHYTIAGAIIWQYTQHGQREFTLTELVNEMDDSVTAERTRNRVEDLVDCGLLKVSDPTKREYKYEVTDEFPQSQSTTEESQSTTMRSEWLKRVSPNDVTTVRASIRENRSNPPSITSISSTESALGLESGIPDLPPPTQANLNRISRRWATVSFFILFVGILYVHVSLDLSLRLVKTLVAIGLFSVSVSSVTAAFGVVLGFSVTPSVR